MGKGEIARNEQFSPFPTVFFYSSRELFTIFIKSKIVVCKLFQFGTAKNLLFGKG